MKTIPTTQKTHIPTIVYVEDNVGDVKLLEEALGERGHTAVVLVFQKGDDALRYFHVKARVRDVPPPHCILLDSHVPMISGAQLLRIVRSSEVFKDTPVYIFTAEAEYKDLIEMNVISKESFITKSDTWEGFLNLADLLMRSAVAKQENQPASPSDSKPEVHAEGALRREDTVEQRDRASGPPKP